MQKYIITILIIVICVIIACHHINQNNISYTGTITENSKDSIIVVDGDTVPYKNWQDCCVPLWAE